MIGLFSVLVNNPETREEKVAESCVETAKSSVVSSNSRNRKEALLNLISFQTSSGKFNITPAVDDILQVDGIFELINNSCAGYEEYWPTAVVSEILLSLFPEHKNLWELVYNKANDFLKFNCKDMNVLVEKAKIFVKESMSGSHNNVMNPPSASPSSSSEGKFFM